MAFCEFIIMQAWKDIKVIGQDTTEFLGNQILRVVSSVEKTQVLADSSENTKATFNNRGHLIVLIDGVYHVIQNEALIVGIHCKEAFGKEFIEFLQLTLEMTSKPLIHIII
jgi:hypothetical protein